MSVKRILLIILTLLLLVGGYCIFKFYGFVNKNNLQNLPDDQAFYVEPGASYIDVFQSLKEQNILIDPQGFDWIASLMKYKKDRVPSGRFTLKVPMSNRQLIGKLRSGQQTPVNLVFNNARFIHELSGKLTANLYLDSISLADKLLDSAYVKGLGYKPETLMSLFIPNTYKVYWNVTVDDLMNRLKHEHNVFWNQERIEKARALNMTKEEVYTLASIVDRESLLKSEKPRIAGVYLNRIKRGILLQADPTVVFATGKFDLRRVLNKHLAIDSPYNTYKYAGLPPGPIGMASIQGIDAVLNFEEHDYIFFCAKPDGKGAHAFAKTLRGHNNNARLYRNWLTRKGIK